MNNIYIKLCKTNDKYDCIIDGNWNGKYYSVKECLTSILKQIERGVLK